jgi:hypothetical protein
MAEAEVGAVIAYYPPVRLAADRALPIWRLRTLALSAYSKSWKRRTYQLSCISSQV